MAHVMTGKILSVFAGALLFVTLAPNALAEYQVIEIKRNLKLEPNEESLHDYYVNAGENQGVKEGMILKVVRRSPVHNPTNSKTTDDIVIPIAELKVIYVSDKISIARLHQLLISDSTPIVDFAAVMSGDRVDLKGTKPGSTAQIEPEILPTRLKKLERSTQRMPSTKSEVSPSDLTPILFR